MTDMLEQPANLEDEVYRDYFNQAVSFHIAGEYPKALSIYQTLLNRLPLNEMLLLNMADALLRMDINGVAANLLISILIRNPTCVPALVHLGLAYRKENLFQLSEECYAQCLALPEGKTLEAYSGMASLFSDSGEPDKCLIYANEALKLTKKDDQAQYSGYWEKSLALLTKGEWEEGFKLYEYRKMLPNWDSRKLVIAKNWENATPEELKAMKSIYIHGEQGVGDEIMFASGVYKFIHSSTLSPENITIEVNPKCLAIFKFNFPGVNVISEAPKTGVYYDIKVAMGTLYAKYFDYFTTAVYLGASDKLLAHYKIELAKLGPPPYIGIAWMGGAKNTRAEFRSIPLELFDPIRKLGTCVSLQYENNPGTDQLREHHKLPKIDSLSVGAELQHQAALAMCCDLVVTCQQTLVHICGSTGAKCFVMLPSNPHWRYGIEGEHMAMYGKHVTLLRKTKGETWKSLFERTYDRIKGAL